MALSLTAGREERMDGAPDPILSLQEERVQAIIAHLMSKDTDGALFQGDPANARDLAVRLMMEEAWKHADEQKAAGRQAAEQASADRRSQRAAAQGVIPEDLPADEFGSVSGRTTQEANRPLDEQEAALLMEQDTADRVTRGLREMPGGRSDWAAEAEYDFLRDRGERRPGAPAGKRDIDYRNRLMLERGQFITMPDGSKAPMGREPTQADIDALMQFDDWANENPGTTRQQLYDPAAYEAFREGVRQDIQDRARADAVTYGTGNERQLKERVQTGDPVAQDQYDRRVERKQSEDRVTKSDWQTRRRMERLAMRDSGDPAQARSELDAALAERDKGLTPEELFMEKKRRGGNLGRIADQEARRDLVREQAMLAGGQPTGGPGGTRATTTAINELPGEWRHVALLDRLSQGRVGGPTPLGMQAANMQLAVPLLRSFLMAGGAQGGLQQPSGERTLAEQLQLSQMPPQDRARLSIQMNEPIGTGLSAAHVGARWNAIVGGGRSIQGREGKVQAFRGEMEGLGYPIEAIDEWIDRRRAADPAAPVPGVTPSPATPPRRRGVRRGGRPAGGATP
jgi:hypothetical protein